MRFCRRWGLSSQTKTKQNRHSIWKRFHKIQNYLYWVIYLLPIKPPKGIKEVNDEFGDQQMLEDRAKRQEHYIPSSAELLGDEDEEHTSEDESSEEQSSEEESSEEASSEEET